MNLTQSMAKRRTPHRVFGRGEAWFYVSQKGVEVCIAHKKGSSADSVVILSATQLKRALKIIEDTQ